jgi:phosphinothricin acetyltransferase
MYNSKIATRQVTAYTAPVSVKSRQNWFDAHESANRPLWIIEDEKEGIAGWASLQDFYGWPAYNGIVEISIYPEEKRRGQGLGKLGLLYCIETAAGLGINNLVGYIFFWNTSSLALFRQFCSKDDPGPADRKFAVAPV